MSSSVNWHKEFQVLVSLRLTHFNCGQIGKYTAHQLDAVRPIVNLNDSQHKTNGDLFEASRPLGRPKKGRLLRKNLYKAVRKYRPSFQ